MKNEIGLIGLAVMGQNLARNIASRDRNIVVFNRTTSKTHNFIEEHGNNFLRGEDTLEGFITSLALPRKIILMVQAGKAVDAVIDQLLPLLDAGDTIIDGGNSYFHDTIAREKKLTEKNIFFVGCGVSGGEEGALKGPSLMPGGKKEALDPLMPLFEDIAAEDFSGGKCVSVIGEDGAGHFVKMVHNGIEYAVMQVLAETYSLLRMAKEDTEDIAHLFSEWNRGQLSSFLVELSATVSAKKESGEVLLDKILDAAGQKGTGRWTVMEGATLGVAIPTISAAVEARIYSSQKTLRESLSEKITLPPALLDGLSSDDLKMHLEKAVYVTMLTAYADGFALIQKAAKEYHWDISFSELARIWQGGCIIRADILRFFEKELASGLPDHLFCLPALEQEVSAALPSLKNITTLFLLSNTPCPAFSATWQEIAQLAQERGSAFFLQALRDAFGAHTFQRIDKDGTFHVQWEE